MKRMVMIVAAAAIGAGVATTLRDIHETEVAKEKYRETMRQLEQRNNRMRNSFAIVEGPSKMWHLWPLYAAVISPGVVLIAIGAANMLGWTK